MIAIMIQTNSTYGEPSVHLFADEDTAIAWAAHRIVETKDQMTRREREFNYGDKVKGLSDEELAAWVLKNRSTHEYIGKKWAYTVVKNVEDLTER